MRIHDTKLEVKKLFIYVIRSLIKLT